MTNQSRFTPGEKLAELRREVALRKKVYPEFIRAGRLKLRDARQQIMILEEVIRDIEREAGIEQLDGLYDLPGDPAGAA